MRRILTNLELTDDKADYDHIKALFEEYFSQDSELHQEYHVLFVEHAKRYLSEKGQLCKMLAS